MEVSKYIAANMMNEVERNKKASSQLSVNDFLKIMAAEIQNQSPMSDGDGGGSKTDYISQLAQFTTLEELSGIAESIGALTMISQQQYAFGLMGKEVTVNGEDRVDGVVDKVKFENGFAIIEVGGKDYLLSQISEVRNPVVEDIDPDMEYRDYDEVEYRDVEVEDEL